MKNDELISYFQKLPCHNKINIVNNDNSKFIVEYKFGKYGSRFVQLSKDEVEKFCKKLDELYKCYHHVIFSFRVDPSYEKELFDTVNSLIANEQFVELREFMSSYIPKTKLDDLYGQRLEWNEIGSVSECCYAFECDRLREILDNIGSIKNKYCRVDFDYSNAMCPRHRIIGDLCCVEGNPVDCMLYKQIYDYLEHNSFTDENGDLHRYWDLPKEKIDKIIKTFVKKLQIKDLILRWR